jgi:hypothetical protein
MAGETVVLVYAPSVSGLAATLRSALMKAEPSVTVARNPKEATAGDVLLVLVNRDLSSRKQQVVRDFAGEIVALRLDESVPPDNATVLLHADFPVDPLRFDKVVPEVVAQLAGALQRARTKRAALLSQYHVYPEVEEIFAGTRKLFLTGELTAALLTWGFLEYGHTHPGLKKAPQLLMDLASEPTYTLLRDRFMSTIRMPGWSEPCRLSADAVALLDAALKIALDARQETTIAARDLLAAMFLLAPQPSYRVPVTLADLGVRRSDLVEAFSRKVVTQITDDSTVWLKILYPDRPTVSVRRSSIADQPRDFDRLGFRAHVTALREFLTSPDTEAPLTVSIEGEWGSGKSSFLLQVERSIRESQQKRKQRDRDVCIRFNAWRHDREDALWAAFALDFIEKVKKQVTLPSRIVGNVRLLWARFVVTPLSVFDVLRAAGLTILLLAGSLYLPYWLSQNVDLIGPVKGVLTGKATSAMIEKLLLGSGGIGGVLLVLMSLWKQVFGFLGNPWGRDLAKHLRAPDYQARVAFIEDFHRDFQKILNAYVRPPRKVFVFIDDLDRCAVPKAADLIQALNLLVSHDSNVVFLLGMDRDKIAASLAAKYKDVMPYLAADTSRPGHDKIDPLCALEYGTAFLEKFLQISLTLPRAGATQLQTFLTKLSNNETETPVVATPVGLKLWRFVQGGAMALRIPVQISARSQAPAETIDREEAAQVDAIARVAPSVAADSDRLMNIVTAVAPTLGNNPRRITQFINVMRLRTYIAASQGKLRERVGDAKRDLTLERLGKFVAIQMMYPRLVADLATEPALLTALQNGQNNGSRAKYWLDRAPLRNILKVGMESGEAQQYNLAELDMDVLTAL